MSTLEAERILDAKGIDAEAQVDRLRLSLLSAAESAFRSLGLSEVRPDDSAIWTISSIIEVYSPITASMIPDAKLRYEVLPDPAGKVTLIISLRGEIIDEFIYYVKKRKRIYIPGCSPRERIDLNIRDSKRWLSHWIAREIAQALAPYYENDDATENAA